MTSSTNLPMAPYQDRQTWMIDVRSLGAHRLKLYGMVAPGAALTEEIIAAAWQQVENAVPLPEPTATPYGFVLIHVGEEAVWLLVDVWALDILRHHLYRAPLSKPQEFTPGPDDGTTACVWELEVVKHERDAWVRHVLSRPAEPQFDDYLADALTINRT